MYIFPDLSANNVNEQPGFVHFLEAGRMFSWVICNYLRTLLEQHDIQKELRCPYVNMQ